MENIQSKKTVLVVSVINAITNVFIAILKIFIGKIAFSQALVADGIHSFSDLISDTFVFFAANAGMKAPDKEHPYGHRRIETIASLLIACLLLSIAFSIAYEACERLLSHTFFKPTWPALVVAILSIFANEALFYYSLTQGKKIHSSLLMSNAWHKRSDSLISIIVLLSILGGYFSIPWLDPIGALIITLLIFYVAFKMIWCAIQELIDRAADAKTIAKIKTIIQAVPGVQSLHQLRTRLHGNAIFVDVHIIVSPMISVSEGHHIGECVHFTLNEEIDAIADVVVHIDPEDDETSHPSADIPDRPALLTQLKPHWEILPGYQGIQKITLHYLSGKLMIEIVLPFSATKEKSAETITEQYQSATKAITTIQDVIVLFRA